MGSEKFELHILDQTDTFLAPIGLDYFPFSGAVLQTSTLLDSARFAQKFTRNALDWIKFDHIYNFR